MGIYNTDVLFKPVTVGAVTVDHRIVLAPLTRFRANEQHVHGDLGLTYYAQRSAYPGTLLISEATLIAQEAGGYACAPGIWSKDQIKGWKAITDVVHQNGCAMFCQLWALGRFGDLEQYEREGIEYVSAGDVPLIEGGKRPRPLTKDDIKRYVGMYRQAALNAMEAGFDGVEVHAANGYLMDQFMQSITNNRTDEYGGSIENRTRFIKEVVEAVVSAVGADRTGIRFAPWSNYGGMGDYSPFPHIISFLRLKYPNLAFLHLINPRINGGIEKDDDPSPEQLASLSELRATWAPLPIILAGGYLPDNAAKELHEAEGKETVLIAMGRYFISNPDLVNRIKNIHEMSKYDRQTFYTGGAKGYIDYGIAHL
ncbi:FMN-linked oxidoreductase [Atractiella rhizophila]|nr:FMN-linked oxidoreductase [Atractiella rhizophila]